MYKPSRANTDDLKEVSRSVVSAIGGHLSDDLFLTRQKQKLSEAHEMIEQLQSRKLANELTSDIHSLDDERDDLTETLESEVESKVKLSKYKPEIAEAASALKQAFDQTPVDIKGGLTTQTNQTDTRIRHCNSEELRTHFETLELLTLWDKLRTTQENYKKKSDERDALESVKLRGTVKEQTNHIKDVMKFILPYLEAQSLDVAGAYDTAAKEVLEAISRVMSVVEARYTRKQNAVGE